MIDQSLLDAVQQDENARAKRMLAAWQAYHGDQPDTLDKRDDEQDDNVRVNLARVVVDATVQALYGQEPAWTTSDDALDAEVDAWHKRRRTDTGSTSPFLLTLQKLAMNGAITGHAWVKWSVRDDGSQPRVRVLDPANVSALWEEDDHETAYAYKVSWQTVNRQGKAVQRRQIIERDTDAAWLIIDEERDGPYGRWRELLRTAWPFAWAPIAGVQNLPCPNEYYGVADLEQDTLALQASINWSASNIARVIRFYGHPRDVGYGFTAREIEMGPGKMPTLPDPKARIDTLPVAGDLASSLAFLATLREGMHATTRTPEVAIGKLGDVGAMSGVALSILFGPLVAKTEQKRLSYGPLVEDVIRQYLVLAGHVGDVDAVEVDTSWPEVVPVDTKAERETAAIDKALGVSAETILENLGYDPAVELERRGAEADAAMDRAARAFDAGQSVDAASSQRDAPPQG